MNMPQDALEWAAIEGELDAYGAAMLPGWFSAVEVQALVALAPPTSPLAPQGGDVLPLALTAPLTQRCGALVRHLAPITRRWQATLGLPPSMDTARMHAQAWVHRLRAPDYQALHQRHDAEPGCALQLVALLSKPERDFTGGAFVLTEQRPRMQSRPMVLPLRPGDAAIIAVAQRPVQGRSGPYRVNLRHAVSRVHQGERLGLEVLFGAGPG